MGEELSCAFYAIGYFETNIIVLLMLLQYQLRFAHLKVSSSKSMVLGSIQFDPPTITPPFLISEIPFDSLHWASCQLILRLTASLIDNNIPKLCIHQVFDCEHSDAYCKHVQCIALYCKNDVFFCEQLYFNGLSACAQGSSFTIQFKVIRPCTFRVHI